MAARGQFGSSNLSPFGGGALNLDQLYAVQPNTVQPDTSGLASLGLTPEQIANILSQTQGDFARNPNPAPVAGSTGATSRYGTQQNPDGSIPMPHPERLAGIVEQITPQMVNAYNEQTGQSGYTPDEIYQRALQHLTMEIGATGMNYQEAAQAALQYAQGAYQGNAAPGVSAEQQTLLQRVQANPGNAAANAVVGASTAYQNYIASNTASSPEEYRIRQQAAEGRGDAALKSFYAAIAAGKTF